MRFCVLGSLRVEDGDRVVALGGRRQRMVLAVLLARHGGTVTTEVLCDDVWAGDPPPSAASTLHGYVSRLRRAVPDRIVSSSPGTYHFAAGDGDEIDADAFERAVARGQAALASGDSATASATLADALATWRGPAYEGLEESSAVRADAIRLDEMRVLAIEQRIAADLDVGVDAELVSELEDLVDAHPLRERFWGQLMLALYRAGRQAEALRAYQRVRRVLGEELGIEPSPELMRLEQSILLQNDELEWRPRASPASHRLPSGTVTFLFTDIEGSTRLASERPSEWPSLLARQRAALRTAIDARGGHEVGTEGDGHFFVFERSSDAVAAALAAQQAVGAVRWPVGGEVRVRMGLHTGEATLVARDYVGVAVHRAARVAAAAHGGQIVASDSTVATAGDSLPEHAVFEDCGMHVLKDLRPMRLWRLRHPSLLDDAGPLRSLSPAPHNLPVQRTSFVGRDDDVAAIVARLAEPGCLTLAGPGGVGKTRLAVQAAAALLDRGDVAAAALVELAPLREAAAVPGALAKAFDLTLGPGDDALEVTVSALAGRRAVVVLDNCEHLVGAAADLVISLARRAPAVSVLATSREPLGVPGEHLLRLAPLPLPDDDASFDDVMASAAVRLFVDRAAIVDPVFRLDAASAAHVAAICRRVDGLPLAVELAAARTRTLSVDQIRSRLDQRFSVLRGDERSTNERQRTLASLIDWSYELLDPDEAAVFRRLGAFVDGCSIDALEEVCAPAVPPDETLDLADRLVAKSLVAVADRAAGRRLVLLESVRDHARGRLAGAGETDEVERRHATLFAAMAAEARGALASERRRGWLDRLDADRDNLRQALRWLLAHDVAGAVATAGDLGWYWYHRGLFAEGRRWIEDALATGASVPADVEARTLTSVARLARYQDDFDAARRYAEEAVRVAREAGSDVDLGWAQLVLGLAGVRVPAGQNTAESIDADALDTAAASVATFRRTDDRWGLAMALFYLGLAGLYSGREDLALPALDESRAGFEELHDEWGVAGNVFYLGSAALQRGDALTARERIAESLEMFRRTSDRWRLARALAIRAEVARCLGEDPEPFLTEAESVRRRLGG